MAIPYQISIPPYFTTLDTLTNPIVEEFLRNHLTFCRFIISFYSFLFHFIVFCFVLNCFVFFHFILIEIRFILFITEKDNRSTYLVSYRFARLIKYDVHYNHPNYQENSI